MNILPKDVTCYPGEERYDMGKLEGDVQNWAQLIENYILQVKLYTIHVCILMHMKLYITLTSNHYLYNTYKCKCICTCTCKISE